MCSQSCLQELGGVGGGGGKTTALRWSHEAVWRSMLQPLSNYSMHIPALPHQMPPPLQHPPPDGPHPFTAPPPPDGPCPFTALPPPDGPRPFTALPPPDGPCPFTALPPPDGPRPFTALPPPDGPWLWMATFCSSCVQARSTRVMVTPTGREVHCPISL